MKGGQYVSKSAMCPFYKKEDKQTIWCFGVIENSSVHLAFGNVLDCKEYKETKCRNDYSKCGVYRMLEEISNE